MSDIPGNVENVKNLLKHPAFDMRNPNKVTLLSPLFSPLLIMFGCSPNHMQYEYFAKIDVYILLYKKGASNCSLQIMSGWRLGV